MKIISAARALYARQRTRLLPIAIGSAVFVPAATMTAMIDGTPTGRAPVAQTAKHRIALAEPARVDTAAQHEREEAVSLAREEAAAREREKVTASYANRHGISRALAKEIYDAAEASDIEPRIAFGLVRTESSFRPRAVSSAGAVGLTQLLPSTARWLVPGTKRSDLFEPRTNLRVGFRYLRYLIDRFDGNHELALTAYNRGPGTVDRLLKRGRNPDNGYAGKVMRK